MVELTVFIDDIEERHISGQVQAWNRAERQKIGETHPFGTAHYF